jgi:hypothetical protein
MGVADGVGRTSSDEEEELQQNHNPPEASAHQRVSILARDDFQNGLCSCLDDVEICT